MSVTRARDFLSVKLLATYFLFSCVIAPVGWVLIQTKESRFAELGSAMFLIPIGIWGIALLILLFILIHEMGHILAGRIVGLKFDELVIGRLRWAKRGSQLHFSETSGSWLDGEVRMLFSEDRSHRWRYTIYILGGPVLITLICLASLAVIALNMTPAQSDRGGLGAAVLGLSVLALSPLIPFTHGHAMSDGAVLIALAKDWPAFHRSLAVSRIVRARRDLVPLEEWSEADFDIASSDPNDKNAYPVALTYRIYKALAQGKAEDARQWLELALTSAPPISGWFYIIRANAAVFFGFYDRDPKRAGDAFSALMPEMFPVSYVFPLARAATRLAQGQRQEAHQAALEAQAAMEVADLDFPPYPYERDIIAQILRETEPEATPEPS